MKCFFSNSRSWYKKLVAWRLFVVGIIIIFRKEKLYTTSSCASEWINGVNEKKEVSPPKLFNTPYPSERKKKRESKRWYYCILTIAVQRWRKKIEQEIYIATRSSSYTCESVSLSLYKKKKHYCFIVPFGVFAITGILYTTYSEVLLNYCSATKCITFHRHWRRRE